MSAIGRSVAPAAASVPKKVYLSKSRLHSGVTGMDGEAFIDLKMRQAGFAVIHPETLGLAEQVNLFRRAELIVGTAGSAFHTLALVPHMSARRVILTLDDLLNSNFLLLDRVCGGHAEYFSIKDDLTPSESAAFSTRYAIRNANHLADRIIAVAS